MLSSQSLIKGWSETHDKTMSKLRKVLGLDENRWMQLDSIDSLSEKVLSDEEIVEKGVLVEELKKLPFSRSNVRMLGYINGMLQLELSGIKKLMSEKCHEGLLNFCDELGASFTSIGTNLQMHGACCAFTDMDPIVKTRAAQFPARFCMVHFYNALNLMGYTAKEVSLFSSNDAHGRRVLLDVFRTALTSEMMDSRQSEYYSDFSLFGIDNASSIEVENNVQPNDVNGEVWLYDKIGEKNVKFRLRPTEDQKQITTGDNLCDRLISDDCETAASFIVALFKSFMIIRAYLVWKEVWDDTILNDKEFSDFEITEEVASALTGVGTQSTPFNDMDDSKNLIKALANCMRQFKMDVNLCIGTASAAAPGMKAKPSGHCFAMFEATSFAGTFNPYQYFE